MTRNFGIPQREASGTAREAPSTFEGPGLAARVGTQSAPPEVARLKAAAVPYSSVVGTSITLSIPGGETIAVIPIMTPTRAGDAAKATQKAIAARIVEMWNREPK